MVKTYKELIMTNQIKIELPYQIPSKEEFYELPFDTYGLYTELKENGDKIVYCSSSGIYQYIKKEGYKYNHKVYRYNYTTNYSSETTYDKNGLLLTRKFSSGFWYEYIYTNNNKVVTYNDSNGYSEQYICNGNDQLLARKD